MYELTKLDVAAFRACDSVTVQYAHDGGVVYLTKTIEKTDRNPFAQDAIHHLDVPVAIRVYNGEDTSHARAYGYGRQYHGQRCEVRSIIRTLRAGDRISFEFCAGAHSTDAMLASGIHGDILRINIRRKGSDDYMQDDTFTFAARVGQDRHRMVMGLGPAPARATA